MSFLDMVAKAKASQGNDGDYFLPDVRGVMTIERIFKHEGDKGVSVILTGIVDSCQPKKVGGQAHSAGSKVKRVYSLSTQPTIAPGQLKRDILAIDGLSEDSMTKDDVTKFLNEIFNNDKSPMFELRGYKTEFDTKVIDRSAKGKTNLTGIIFKHLDNDAEELSARAAEISARLGK